MLFFLWYFQSASEWAGVAPTLSLIVCTAQGFELFDKMFQCHGNKTDSEMENDMDSNVPGETIEEDVANDLVDKCNGIHEDGLMII